MMIGRRFICAPLLALLALAIVAGCSVSVSNNDAVAPARSPAPRPAAVGSAGTSHRADEGDDETDEQAWQAIRSALGKAGEFRDGVLAFAFPRDDLEVTIQGNDTPVAAGIASDFRFYRCPCGMINVVGQFVVADYETNDVLDSLREGRVEIASVGPFLLHERPRLMLIRFQGENKHGGKLAQTLRTALTWTGKERMAPQKLDH
jgi:hypothetical protein